MERTIYGFIWRYSKPQQISLLVLTLISFPFLYISLDLPKMIVNDGIQGQSVPDAVFGMPVDQVAYLMLLSFAYLFLVLVNGGFKYFINTMKGRVGERMLRRLRYQLYAHMLRFPLPHFKRVSQGELIAMTTAEVEPLGGFIGDAFAQPIFQGGTLLVYMAFIFVQDPILGLAAIALYPVQGWLIPRLQKRVNRLGKERVRAVRQIADRVGETAAGALTVRSNQTAGWHLADLSGRLGDVFAIRFEIYQRKFFIKFLNNFINQLTPFFFYSIGGYLVITGDLSFGALVAVLAAYKDMAAPWRELLNFYQQSEDARIKYGQVVENFRPAGLVDLPRPETGAPIPHLQGPVQIINLAYGDEGLIRHLDGATCTIALDRPTALLDGGGGGRSELALLLARLLKPASGSIRVGDTDLAELPEAVVGRRIAYVGSGATAFTGTLRDNLTYPLRQRPAPITDGSPSRKPARWQKIEAEASGNDALDAAGDWLDPEIAGAADRSELDRKMLRLLDVVELSDDVFRLGLSGTVDPASRSELAGRVLEARRAMAAKLEEPALRGFVERFDPGRIALNATLAENLLFGTPADATFTPDGLSEHPYVLAVLEKANLTRRLVDIGCRLAGIVAEMYATLPPGHPFYQRLGFLGAEDVPALQQLVQRIEREGRANLAPADRARVLGLAFRFVPARHRVGLWTRRLEADLLQGRGLFAAELPTHLRPSIAFFEPDTYNPAASILDNILFGKPIEPAEGNAPATDPGRVDRAVTALVRERGLYDGILDVGLAAPAGVMGSRLTMAQRQKLALAQVLLKQPDLLVLNEAFAGLDGAAQTRILDRVLQWQQGRGVVAAVDQPGLAQRFAAAVVLSGGRVAEQGAVADLLQPGTRLHQLVAAPEPA